MPCYTSSKASLGGHTQVQRACRGQIAFSCCRFRRTCLAELVECCRTNHGNRLLQASAPIHRSCVVVARAKGVAHDDGGRGVVARVALSVTTDERVVHAECVHD
eukprot:scaffold4331_cov400-Prasinococcus_capsulatus_cf.AAC.9